MKHVVTILLLMLCLAGAALASNSVVFGVTLCTGCAAVATPTPTGIQPIGNPALPPGTTHWVLTSDDEFNTDGSLNTSLWNGGGGVPSGDTQIFCAAGGFDSLGYGATCGDQYYGTLGTAPYATLNPGTGAQIQAEIVNGGSSHYWAALQTVDRFTQKYGYWEISAKQPHDNNGEGDGAHPDIWLTVPCRSAFVAGARDSAGCNPNEADIAENNLSTQSCAKDQVHSSVFDGVDSNGDGQLVGPQSAIPSNGTSDLSSAFHTYAAQWAPPGANSSTGSQGSWQFYFDGSSQAGPTGINDSTWTQGVYLLLWEEFTNDTYWCGTPANGNTTSNDPLIIKYVRIWQAK